MTEDDRAYFNFLTTYLSPDIIDLEKIGKVETEWRTLLKTTLENCPKNKEREKSINYLRTALFWARESVKHGNKDSDM
jgi:hypothetical protein